MVPMQESMMCEFIDLCRSFFCNDWSGNDSDMVSPSADFLQFQAFA